MSTSLRILHTADSHIGADLPVRGNGKYARRGSDFVTSFRRVLARAHEYQVDVVIHAGDLFDRSHPGDGAITAGTEPLWQLAQAGLPVVIVPGNHERSVLPGALLLSHPNIHVLRERQTVVLNCHGLRVAIAGLPCLRRTASAGFAQAVQATNWKQAHADVNLLAVHQTFAGARCGPANFQFRTGDDVVPREAIPPGFHCIAAGHIHRYQILSTLDPDGPPLVYCGSPDRIAFAELGEPKGCVIVDFVAGRARPRFVEHAVRPMEIVPFDVTGLSGSQVVEHILELIQTVPAEAVVQVRLSGQATRRSLSGLQATTRIRAARPDLIATVSSRAIEWITDRAAFRVASQRDRSAFDVLDAPPAPTVKASVENLGALPTTCGTYALYDAAGRLLYIGKALRVRTRVRSHLRDSTASNHFRGWARQITFIEVRPAGSELEALLVEAELVRRLSPPFNQQMRLWKRYCYLCSGREPLGQLAITSDPCGRFTFGPLRSRARAEGVLDALCSYFLLARCPDEDREKMRALPPVSPGHLCERYFAGNCSGPCGGRISDTTYAQRLQARDVLLTGVETEDAARIRAAAAQTPPADPLGTGTTERERLLNTIADVCTTAAALREARGLLNAPLLLPGSAGRRTVAVVTPHGLRLEQLASSEADAERVLTWYRAQAGSLRRSSNPALPKPVADSLLTAARERRRRPGDCEVIPAQDMSRLSPATLLASAFGTEAAGSAGQDDGSCRPTYTQEE